jgi:replicative DNA helicase
VLEILTVLDTKDNYSIYYNTISKYSTDKYITRILQYIDKYYRDTTLTTIEWSSFGSWFFVKNPLIKDTQKSLYESMFTKLEAAPTALKSDLVSTFMARHYAEKIAHISMEVMEGRRSDLSDVYTEVTTYLDSSGKIAEIESERLSMALEDILEDVAVGSGLNWRLNAFNESLGPLRLGNLVLIAARPEAGKTSLLCSEATFMAEQLPEGKKVIYFTNEEGPPVRLRLYQAALGKDLEFIVKNPLLSKSTYGKLMSGDMDKIIVVAKPDIHINDIEYWVKKEDVGLICIDQLRKVYGHEDIKGGIQRLEKIFQTAREWAKTYAPVITVSQLDSSAEDFQYPSMACLYESKTAVQGECDVIINMGMISGSVPPNARWLNIVKNKLPTPGDISLRHGKHEVRILPEISRFS